MAVLYPQPYFPVLAAVNRGEKMLVKLNPDPGGIQYCTNTMVLS